MPLRLTRRDVAGGAAAAAFTWFGREAFAQAPAFFRIGTGGTYHPVGSLIANAISAPPRLVLTAQASNGSVANVNGIVSGALESGFCQADIGFWAHTGTGLFEGKGKAIRKETALAGPSVPLHPGAEKFYKEAGLLT